MLNILIFDFTGVITKENFFPAFSRECQSKLGMNPKRLRKEFSRVERRLELGEMSCHDFWEISCKDSGIPFDGFASAFLSAYEVDGTAISLIRELKSRYRIFMLSESLDLLSDAIRNEPALSGLFERMFFSNELHMTKRASACFGYVLREIGAKAEECLFIDDRKENLVSAMVAGMRTLRYKGVERLKRRLEKAAV